MTNPLAKQFAAPCVVPVRKELFEDPSLPCFLDIGCAKGRYIQELSISTAFKDKFGPHNFLGVEIFAPLVLAANLWRDTNNIRNLHFINASANVCNFEEVIRDVNLTRVSIQFPDPYYGNKIERRVVTPELIAIIAKVLPKGGRGELFIVSDVLEMAEFMRDIVMKSGLFQLHPLHATNGSSVGWGERAPSTSTDCGAAEEAAEGEVAGTGAGTAGAEGGENIKWLRTRPYIEATERDKVCETMWRTIYRTLFVTI